MLLYGWKIVSPSWTGERRTGHPGNTPRKRLKLIIIVVNIPVSYGMLLSQTFCKDMGKEIKMDWSEAIIPMEKRKVRLEPELKEVYSLSIR